MKYAVSWVEGFHTVVLVALWVLLADQLWISEFGNVLSMAALIAVWKMKGKV